MSFNKVNVSILPIIIQLILEVTMKLVVHQPLKLVMASEQLPYLYTGLLGNILFEWTLYNSINIIYFHYFFFLLQTWLCKNTEE